MRLSEKAYRLIKEKIITLELPPSSLVNEQSLMDELGLGRTPIREALQRLAAEDLVTVIPRRGIFVADISITDLQKIFEARIVLEGFGARLAAQRVTEGQLAEMDVLIQKMAQVPEGEVKALMDIDESLHRLLYTASDNEFIVAMLMRLYDLSLRLWYLVLDRLGDVQASIEEHRAIVEALRAGDAALAEKLVQEHVSGFQRRIKSVL